jgi:methionine aminopeptidase
LKKPLPYMHNFNFDYLNIIKVGPYNIRTTKVIINATEKKNKKNKKNTFFEQTHFISTSPFISKSQMLKHTNKSHNIFINKFHRT